MVTDYAAHRPAKVRRVSFSNLTWWHGIVQVSRLRHVYKLKLKMVLVEVQFADVRPISQGTPVWVDRMFLP